MEVNFLHTCDFMGLSIRQRRLQVHSPAMASGAKLASLSQSTYVRNPDHTECTCCDEVPAGKSLPFNPNSSWNPFEAYTTLASFCSCAT